MKLNRNYDIKIVLIFQLVTLILYYLGPVSFTGIGKSYLILIYVCLYILALYSGYKLGGKYILVGKTGPNNYLKFLNYSMFYSFVFIILDYIFKLDIISTGINIGNIGENYNKKNEIVSNSDQTYEYVKMFFGYFIFGFFPVYLSKYSSLSYFYKLSGVLVIFLTLMFFILSGTNRIIFNYIIILTIFYLNNFKLNYKSFLFFIVCPVIFYFAFVFFTQGQLTRYGSAALTGYDPNLGSYTKWYGEDSLVLTGFSALTTYLIQGYRALDLGLNIEIDWTYGLGNSTFFSRQIDKIFYTNISNQTLPAKIEYFGWDRYNYWSSFYGWWVSDIGYFGVIFLMLFIGFYFRVIKNTLNSNENDIAALILYYYFIIMLFYLSANNQIFQSGEGSIGFLLLFIPFILFRKFKKII